MEILLRNVWFSYDGEVYVLKRVNAVFDKRGLYIIVGPNGSGKTTLLKIVSLIYKPCLGEIILNGENVLKMPKYRINEIRKNIIYVHDKPIIIRGNVERNIRIGIDIHQIKDDDTIEYFIDRYSLNKLRYSDAKKLSIGQAKLISLLRAFILKPKVLVLDEPFTFLDQYNSFLVMEDLQRLILNGTMVIMSTHYMQQELFLKALTIYEMIYGELRKLK
jgi:ABC-type multidrug transport system ATPase subunit